MAERKVLNKYYPPDFDPLLLKGGKRPEGGIFTVRNMMPMSVRCNTCGEYIYRGKKFNSRMETVKGENYLGIKIFRFYQRCPNCSAEFSFKTDPEHSDYVAEFNCTRNFEPWKAKADEIQEVKDARKDEDDGDVMKALENRTNDNKVEMEIIDALDEIRALNSRNAKVDVLEILKRKREEANALTRQEELEIQNIFFKHAGGVKRLLDEEEDNDWDSVEKEIQQTFDEAQRASKRQKLETDEKNPTTQTTGATTTPNNNSNIKNEQSSTTNKSENVSKQGEAPSNSNTTKDSVIHVLPVKKQPENVAATTSKAPNTSTTTPTPSSSTTTKKPLVIAVKKKTDQPPPKKAEAPKSLVEY